MTTVLDRLCFGTSTFVAGRLVPDKDSNPGVAALRAALSAGVRLLHSNPKLRTQWAIRQVLDSGPSRADVRHLIKAEAPLGVPRQRQAALVREAIETSYDCLGVPRVHGLVAEIDLKRTDPRLHHDHDAARAFYEHTSAVAFATGAVANVYGYCHNSTHVRAALAFGGLGGLAATFHRNQPWPAEHLGRIADAGKNFIGMAPLARGALIDHGAKTPIRRLAAIPWALANPAVTAVAVTMSSPEHFAEVAAAISGLGTLGLWGRNGEPAAEPEGANQ